MTDSVRVACCQASPSVTDPEAGLRSVVALARSAAQQGARVVVLPELSTTGYVFESAAETLAGATTPDGPALAPLRRLSEEHDVVVVVGFAERAGDTVYNSAAVIDRGAVVGTYRKVHLWGDEPSWFAAASADPLVVATSVGTLGVMICYDLEFPEWVRLARQRGAELVCAPVNWPALQRPSTERPLEVIKAQAAAGSYRVPVAIADRVGVERGVDWIGGSTIIGADGYLLAPLQLGREGVVWADVTLDRDSAIGPRNDAMADRRPELYGEV